MKNKNHQFRYTFHSTEWIVILSIAFFPILLGNIRHLVGGTERYFHTGTSIILLNSTYSFITTISLYLGCTFIFQYLNHYFPWEKSIWQRIWREVILIIGFAAVAQFIILIVFYYFTPIFIIQEFTFAFYFENFLFGTGITLIVVCIFEGVHLFRRWKQSLVEKELLEKENLRSQLGNLKAQLDPHFMFNSLNVLGVLINKNPKKAEFFLERFANVYRYILETKNDMVVPLKKELEFIDSHTKLQQIRFDSALEISTEIDKQYLEYFVAPLSLQETVGNAIKHNEVSKEHPLYIRIQSQNGGIQVKNNLQRRQENVTSTGVGLENLKQRYEILSQQKPTFEQKNGHFVAWIPLIEKV